MGEKEGRCAELGGKDECGLLKLYITGRPFAGRGELAGECFTGEPAGPVAVPGRLKLWLKLVLKLWAIGVCCDGPNGFGRPNELPFCCAGGIRMLLNGLVGAGGKLKGGGEEPRPFDRKELSAGRDEEAGRCRIGEELGSGSRDGDPYAASEFWMPGGPRA